MFPAGVVVSDALRNTLVDLEATDPVFLYKKTMEASDRVKGQNRLLISCKKKKKKNGEAEQQALLDHIFTEKEKIEVHRRDPGKPDAVKKQGKSDGCGDKDRQGNKRSKKRDDKDKSKKKKRDKDKSEEEDTSEAEGENKEKEKSKAELGLPVRAYDRDGRQYDVRWRYLASNTAYRIIGKGWGVFLRQNGLLNNGGGGGKRRKLSPGEEGGGGGNQSPTSSPDDQEAHDEHEEKDAGVFNIQLWTFRSRKLGLGDKDGHPQGALGLVLLHNREGEDADIGEDNEEMIYAHEVIPTEDGDAGDVVAPNKGTPVVAAAAVGGKPGGAAPRSAARGERLTLIEVVLAQTLPLLKVRDRNNRAADPDASNCVCKQQGPKCTCSDDHFVRAGGEQAHRAEV